MKKTAIILSLLVLFCSACFAQDCSPACPESITVSHVASDISPVTVTITYSTTEYNGKCWLTRNLGATAEATSVDDGSVAAVGWYWQFNRKQGYLVDETTRTPATEWISNISETSDWVSANDPCTLLLGPGWHIPTHAEFKSFGISASTSAAAFAAIKINYTGNLSRTTSDLQRETAAGYYSTTTSSDTDNSYLFHVSDDLNSDYINRKGYGWAVRCVGDL